MRLLFRLLLLCFALSAPATFAAPVTGLYQVREPIDSQQADERAEALQRAFDTLVLRLTGDAGALKQPAIAELRKRPEELISKYGYEPDHLLVDFDPATTESRLRQAGLALWGANRPSVLTWWLFDTPQGSQLVGDGQSGATPLRQAAQRRGLPLRLPLADLDEQLLATEQTLTSHEASALREPSERYDADVLLAVYARGTDDDWRASWQLVFGEERTRGEAKGASREALADAVMLAVNEYLAPRFAVAPGALSDLLLDARGANLERFAELDRLLEPLGGKLLQVNGDRVLYALKSSREQLRTQLALIRLEEVPDSERDDGAQPVAEAEEGLEAGEPIVPRQHPGTPLHYRW